MDTVVLVDPENCAIGAADGKKRGDMDSAQRKKLADISNLQRRLIPTNQDAKQKYTALTTKEYVEKLHKENVELAKLLADRNKLIELSAMEIQKLRINYQKVYQQNLQLAQANSQMLADLNSGKDRLKVLQHELGCKNGLLMARKFEAGEKRKRVTCQNYNDGVCSTSQEGESLQADKENKRSNARRKQSRTQSLGPPAVKAVRAKDEADNKRHCSRRQSARFTSKESKATEDSFEIDDDVFPVDVSGETLSSVRDDPADAIGQALSSLHDDPVDAQEEDNKKRHYPRRQSARFKSEELEATENSVEIDNKILSVSSLNNNPVDGIGKTLSSLHDDPADANGQMLSSEHDDPVDSNEEASKKRRCSRRQSARFKSKEEEAIKDYKFLLSSLSDNPVHKSCEMLSSLHDDPAGASCQMLSSLHDNLADAGGRTLLGLSDKKIEDNATLNSEAQEFRRSSVGRPVRRAAEKVQSYKEISITAKMRRTE
ncbi:Shugoshin, C-terminal [Parasponia andersonii]|uniref:Shugoshin, C-terminal n=1 Tax=Parasponia andersonii TaxID=3476 RepID=A0A2P5AX52_PARAD|nr:Shugoshin, C-terminal [Parasponia andersonii]